MVSHMKTTINISDSLLEEAKELTKLEKSTLRALVEEGLHRVISERKTRKKFTLRKVCFQGHGLQPEFDGEGWQKIRSAAYEGRGG
ncbi:MAG: type II toxin-antitoxin system VapB family antitoxin [Proteobacteria bacterium]|nr:type II toxin-antitoxin system VapB family antitoxin [Pseudomonadota bacterium]